MPPPKIGDGTGSTPTLMGFGPDEDKLVVITDGAKKMRLVAFWRDQIPAGWMPKREMPSPRIVDQIEVDMGPQTEIVQSEQSVAVYGDYAFVVNNIVSNETATLSTQGFYVNLINGATRPGPTGAAAFKWSTASHSWAQQWTRKDVSSISVVPMISGGSRMAIIDGYYANKWNERHRIGMDLDTGRTVMDINVGSDPVFNGMYAPIKVDFAGNIFYGAAFGLVHVDIKKMTPVSGNK